MTYKVNIAITVLSQQMQPPKYIRENRQINFPLPRPLITSHEHSQRPKNSCSICPLIGLEDF